MKMTRLSLTALMAVVAAVSFVSESTAATIVDFTDFASATPVGTDGRGAGFSNPGGTTFDTTQGWTWYTESSTTNDNLTIPFGGGSETIGEQGIRVGAGLELQTNTFFFGWGGNGTALALRSETYTDVAAGTATIDWAASNTSGFNAYYSQDGGTAWTALADNVSFATVDGSLEVVFVANDGADSNTQLDTISITYQLVPEPSSVVLATFSLLGLVGLAIVRRRKNH